MASHAGLHPLGLRAKILLSSVFGPYAQNDEHGMRIRRRFRREVFPLRSTYAGAVWAMKKYYRKNRRASEKMASLLRDIYREFGWMPRMPAPLIGRFLHFTMKKEASRLATGWTHEPKTFCEKNLAALVLENAANQSPLHRISKGYLPAPVFVRTGLHQNT